MSKPGSDNLDGVVDQTGHSEQTRVSADTVPHKKITHPEFYILYFISPLPCNN